MVDWIERFVFAEDTETVHKLSSRYLLVDRDGAVSPVSTNGIEDQFKGLIIPGAFDPLHEGHLSMSNTLQAMYKGQDIAFELSVSNIDKGVLPLDDVRGRIKAMAGHNVLITRAPLFTDKASLFPMSTFGIGADTLARLVDTKYYGGSQQTLDQAFHFFFASENRFVVFPRQDAEGVLKTMHDYKVPEQYQDLFMEAEAFEPTDISSTSVRESTENS